MPTETLNVRSRVTYIDPEGCGSTIGYRIWTEKWTPSKGDPTYTIAATVELSDCNRKIEWDFGIDSTKIDGTETLCKLDTAIGMLEEFRKELVATQKQCKKLREQQGAKK